MEMVLLVRGEAAMRDLGRRLGPLLAPGDCLLLTGPLGAGKTTLAQGLGEGLGVAGPVTSPTFTLVREHAGPPGRPGLVHMDFYRLGGEAEAWDLGLADYLAGDEVLVVEWAERVPGLAPPAAIRVRFEILDEARRLTWTLPARAEALAAALVGAAGAARPAIEAGP